ncbi:roadblock/LC7 domain-containing protein [Dactylosporangium sp. AC04546]|uniref:roadblock/LC7 domain-containing protein n=1 Tax=Dactylosporangium sp. AC04546 TaxID=2862460 RepID=UPI001EDCBA79|nr:roadblock/LC7 domain-containing protein [Dactylosporangium sp. AC04546]WVK78890.1 roadblock/LC7 domain-containing protein [Dactylosporangium sp. AC04546]
MTNVGFLLNQLCEVRGITHALVVSGDGLPMAASPGLPNVDQLSAVTSGLASLTTGAATFMEAAPVEQIIVEMAGGFLITMVINDKSILTVLARKDCELGQVSYEMAMTIDRVGGILTPDTRQPQRA